MNDFPTPTPAHQAFREKTAEDWVKRECGHHVLGEHPHITASVNKTNRTIFLAGMEAEHEVARLIEREILHRACAEVYAIDNPQVSKEHKNWANAAAQALAALLEGK